MNTNIVYDVIIVGASSDGIELCKYLITKNQNLKIALISKHFNNVPKKVDLSKITCIEQPVVYSSYFRGLIGFTLNNNKNIFGLHAVIATGSKPEKLPFESNNIYYKKLDVKNASKRKQAVVYGNNSEAVAAAIWAAKKFRYVYLCSNTLTVSCGNKNRSKFEAAENIVQLPNCNIVSCRNNQNNDLVEITLNTYDTIKCSAIIAITKRTPELPRLASNMITTDKSGYIKINHFCETGIVPKLYAIGTCTNYPSKHNVVIVGKAILADYKN